MQMYYATVRYVHYFDYPTIITRLHPIRLLYKDDTKTKTRTRNKNNNDKNEDEDDDHYTTLTTFRSLMREPQQPTSPIGFLFLKLPTSTTALCGTIGTL